MIYIYEGHSPDSRSTRACNSGNNRVRINKIQKSFWKLEKLFPSYQSAAYFPFQLSPPRFFPRRLSAPSPRIFQLEKTRASFVCTLEFFIV